MNRRMTVRKKQSDAVWYSSRGFHRYGCGVGGWVGGWVGGC